MRIETFFDKFDLLAETPGAVGKMRELVLELAVQGRLSSKAPGDGSVAELYDALSRASDNRDGQRRRRLLSTADNAHPIVPPIGIPTHWAWVPLNEIGSLSGGMTPSKARSIFWDGDVNWFSSKDIKADDLFESGLKITAEAVKATGLQLYQPGCLFMVARSGILKRTFPVAVNRVEGTANQDLKVLTPFISGMERYLQIMFRGMTDFILASLVKTGMTVQSLKYEDFEAQSFPLPPLAEQRRIVAKVDELMALCDRLEAREREREVRRGELARAAVGRFGEEATVGNVELLFHRSYTIDSADLRKAILTIAVQGKLVPQDSSDESVADLLTRESASRKQMVAQGTLRDEKSLEPTRPDNEPSILPASWGWCRIDRLVFSLRNDIRTGPFGSALHKHDHRLVGVPVWGIETIGKDGGFTGRNNIFVHVYRPVAGHEGL